MNEQSAGLYQTHCTTDTENFQNDISSLFILFEYPLNSMTRWFADDVPEPSLMYIHMGVGELTVSSLEFPLQQSHLKDLVHRD